MRGFRLLRSAEVASWFGCPGSPLSLPFPPGERGALGRAGQTGFRVEWGKASICRTARSAEHRRSFSMVLACAGSTAQAAASDFLSWLPKGSTCCFKMLLLQRPASALTKTVEGRRWIKQHRFVPENGGLAPYFCALVSPARQMSAPLSPGGKEGIGAIPGTQTKTRPLPIAGDARLPSKPHRFRFRTPSRPNDELHPPVLLSPLDRVVGRNGPRVAEARGDEPLGRHPLLHQVRPHPLGAAL